MNDAELLARAVHGGQTDQAGQPYIEHVERVVSRLKASLCGRGLSGGGHGYDEAIQVAWLHDVLEPDDRPFGALTSDDLLEEGFAAEVVEAVAGYLTRGEDETYAEYIRSISEESPLTVLLVKLADLEDNSDTARLVLLPQATAASLSRRYEPAKATIRAALSLRFGVHP